MCVTWEVVLLFPGVPSPDLWSPRVTSEHRAPKGALCPGRALGPFRGCNGAAVTCCGRRPERSACARRRPAGELPRPPRARGTPALPCTHTPVESPG